MLVAIVCMSATSMLQDPERVQEIVRTKGIEVVNDEGLVVVMASSDRPGTGWLSVRNQEGRLAFLAQGVEDRGRPGQLRVYGPMKVMSTKEKNLVYAGPGDTGHGSLAVSNQEGEPWITAGGSANGGELQISNKTGERVITLGVDEDGFGEVGAWDREGKGRTLSPRN